MKLNFAITSLGFILLQLEIKTVAGQKSKFLGRLYMYKVSSGCTHIWLGLVITWCKLFSDY